MTDPLPIVPFTRPARGRVVVPGSKSLTNRALVLAALCPTPVTLVGALFSDDTRYMAEGLRRLGLDVAEDAAAGTIRVAGQHQLFTTGRAAIEVGLAGTAARFLTALCAAAPAGEWRIDGTEQMRRRPMRGLIEALRALGADLRCEGVEGCLPVTIRARGLRGGRVPLDARASSQLLSALLMAAPLAAAPVEVELIGDVRRPFVAMTAQLMTEFGQPAPEWLAGDVVRVPAGRPYAAPAAEFRVEPDASAASYFLALPLVTGGRVELPGVLPAGAGLQGDTQFVGVLQSVGLHVRQRVGGGLEVEFPRGARGRGVEQDFREFSDTFLTLAAVAPLLDGPTTIDGVEHTRAQETDRVAAMAAELRRLGQEVAETEDRLVVQPRPLRPATVETHGDHRFAMSLAILGCHDLHGDGRPWLHVREPGVCAKTYPEFFDHLAAVHASSHGEA
jgi:3-phosphoshikimate 1-carboxyvinyltransferase